MSRPGAQGDAMDIEDLVDSLESLIHMGIFYAVMDVAGQYVMVRLPPMRSN